MRSGKLERGKFADFLVLDRDYMTVPEDQIESIKPLMTVVGGKVVHLTPTLARELKMQPAGGHGPAHGREVSSPGRRMTMTTHVRKRAYAGASHSAIAIGVLLLTIATTSAQQVPTGVTISQTAGSPGAEVTTPIYLAAAKGVRIGAVTLRITFPGALVAFERAESDLEEAIGAKVRTAVKPHDDQTRSVLELNISVAAGDGKAIPDGPLARLTFQISKDAKLSTEIPLEASAVVVTTDDPPKEVAPVRAYDGKISVTAEAIFSCFFYMH